ncbi:MAG: hypothetical protein E7Z86_10745, partial [Methanosphaera stadtmanae]|nr:hypothetical protein [Methanosphaera stadtmanae]
MEDVDNKYVQDMLNQYPLMKDVEEDKRDYNLDDVVGLSKTDNLPKEYHIKYDYIPYLPKQNNISGCSVCATITAMMIQLYTNKKLSWIFAYTNRQDSDYLDMYEALINSPNKEAIFTETTKNKMTGYIKINESEVNSMLAQGIPVLVSVRVYDSFYNSIKNNYIIPEAAGNERGVHEMLLLGYNDETKLRNTLNWWDGEWNHELLLPYYSDIVTDYFIITDKIVIMPEIKKYTVGWNKDNTGWWYSEDGLTYVKLGWKKIKDRWFYFDDKGYAYCNKWLKDKNNEWYYFDKDCYMVTDKWILDNNKWYRLGSDGAMLTEWFKDSNGKWCYLDIENGYAYKNCTILIDGKYYSFDEHCYWIESKGLSTKGAKFIESWEGFSSTW